MGKFLIVTGLSILGIGIMYLLMEKSTIGRLPGDLVLNFPSGKIYFPIVTSIIVSIVLTVILNLVFRK